MDPLIQQDKDPQKNHQENRAEKHCKFCFVFPYLFHKRSLFLYKTANAFIILSRRNRFYRVYVNTMKKTGMFRHFTEFFPAGADCTDNGSGSWDFPVPAQIAPGFYPAQCIPMDVQSGPLFRARSACAA